MTLSLTCKNHKAAEAPWKQRQRRGGGGKGGKREVPFLPNILLGNKTLVFACQDVEGPYLFQLDGRKLTDGDIDDPFAPPGPHLFDKGSGWGFGHIDDGLFHALFQGDR